MERSVAGDSEWPRLLRHGGADRVRPDSRDRRERERGLGSAAGELTLDLAADPIHQRILPGETASV